jgi:predicted GIY-YIG superfamily endonuclease
MLLCAAGSFYTGCTTDLETRFGQHQGGTFGGYTATRRPVELVWAEEFQHIDDAIAAERRIKGWSRAKKEALIRGDWSLVQWLAKRPSGRLRATASEQPHLDTPDVESRGRTETNLST